MMTVIFTFPRAAVDISMKLKPAAPSSIMTYISLSGLASLAPMDRGMPVPRCPKSKMPSEVLVLAKRV